MNRKPELLTVATFSALLRNQGLRSGVTYSFASRLDANQSADVVRAETMWVTLWVGPQQFEVN